MVEGESGAFRSLIDLFKRFGGAALGVIGLALSVYFFWYQEYGKNGEVSIIVNSTGNVLTVQRQVPDLEVLYRGESLVGVSKSLRFYSVQVRNTGPVHILKTFFDDQIPWGLRLRGAVVLQITSASFSAPALENTKPYVSPTESIVLSPVNLDTGDWIRIDFLALTDKDKEPVVEALGRISGTRLAVRNEVLGQEPGLLEQAFAGSVWVQGVRAISYFFGFILSLVAVAGSLALIAFGLSSIQEALRRRHLTRVFFADPGISEKKQNEIFRVYELGGIGGLAKLYADLNSEKALNDAVRSRKYLRTIEENRESNSETNTRLMLAHEVDRTDSQGYGIQLAFGEDGEVDPIAVKSVSGFVERLVEALSREGILKHSEFRKPERVNDFAPLEVMSLVSNRAAARA